MPHLNAVGKTYKSFTITKHLPLKELHCTLVEAIHLPTGAKILHIGNDDPENLFCLSFQTLPSSSNGVAHILEHTVLCGSKKFPIKDPFFSMTRRSLNTYMNALTGQDFTCYPASSQVEKDFYHLLDVYLDAVFHPELKRLSFLQEGHRLEWIDSQKNKLQFQGIVYNEMKGAMSSPESRLWQTILKHLTPDLPYAHNSGGDPKEIPKLTYEEFKQFHSIFYHPSRCLFFFYGNLPLTKHLDFLLEHAFPHVEKIAPLSPLPLQRRFSSPIFVTDSYPVAESESLEKKTWIVFSFLTAQLIHQEDVLALCLLESLLMETDASPLNQALLKSKLCTSVESSVDTEMCEVPFSIICKGSEEKHAPAIKNLIFKTLQNVTFSQQEIEASIHQLEFQRTEIGAEGIPFGLTLFFRAGIIKQQGSEAENALLIHSLFNDLRKRLVNPDFLPSLVRKYLIENPHYVELIFKPSHSLEKKEKEEEEKWLERLLPTVDKNALLAQTKDLADYQEAIETQSLDCLPKLTLQDIPLKTKDFSLSESHHEKFSIFHHSCFTNQILYADLIYDLPFIAAEDLPLVSIYIRFMTELGCGGRNYQENLAYQQAYTGGVNASLALHIAKEKPEICHPTFSLRGKALKRNGEKLFSLFGDFIKGADCNDLQRVQELLLQYTTSLQNKLTKNALNYAIQTSLSGFSASSFIYDQWNGLSQYQAAMKWAQNPKHLSKELMRIQEHIVGRGSPHLVLSCEQELFDEIQRAHFFHLENALPHKPIHKWENPHSIPKNHSHVRLISSPVASTSRGTRTIGYHDPRSAFLLIATELLDNCHLHKEIREKGGAYGSGASYAPHTGNFYLYAFRDPNLSKTIDTFQKALLKIAQGQFTDQDLSDAKFGVIQILDAPVPPGNRAIVAYAWKRAGRTFEERQVFRNNVLQATRQQIADAVRDLVLPQDSILISFLGEELYKKEQEKLKSELPVLPIH